MSSALRLTLRVGGILLVVSGAASLAAGFVPVPSVVTALSWVGSLSFVAALVVFALGTGPGGSIVARRPLGVTALLVYAVIPWFMGNVLFGILPLGPGSAELFILTMLMVSLVSGLIAVIAILRAGVLPRGWRSVPLWAFVVAVIARGAVWSRFAAGALDEAYFVLASIVFIGISVAILALGVLAVAASARSEGVQPAEESAEPLAGPESATHAAPEA